MGQHTRNRGFQLPNQIMLVLAVLLLQAVTAKPLTPLKTMTKRAEKNFELTATWATQAPDGVERGLYLINGQFPGPEIRVDEGDDVVILVHNQTPENLTLHYHGKFKE